MTKAEEYLDIHQDVSGFVSEASVLRSHANIAIRIATLEERLRGLEEGSRSWKEVELQIRKLIHGI